MTGITASPDVNVDEAKAVGQLILKKMEGQSIKDYKFRKVDQCVVMSAKSTQKIGMTKNVDPALLFQRLVTIAGRSVEKQESCFTYELCSHPSSMFDNNGMPRAADKPELAKAISTLSRFDPLKCPVPSKYHLGFCEQHSI